MGYTYTPGSTIQLPLLSASACLVLCTRLLTAAADQQAQLAAAGQTLPSSIARPLARLQTAAAELEKVLDAYLPETDPQASREADLVLDRGWSGLNDVLAGWAKARPPFNPDPEGIAALQALLFPNGLDFVRLDFETEWQQSQSRLNGLKAKASYLETLGRLGAMPLLENIRDAHARYADALGISTVNAAETAPAVKETRQAAFTALRDYIAKVMAWVDPEEAGSEALANALLAPLASWETKESSSRSTASPDAAPATEGESAAPA